MKPKKRECEQKARGPASKHCQALENNLEEIKTKKDAQEEKPRGRTFTIRCKIQLRFKSIQFKSQKFRLENCRKKNHELGENHCHGAELR